MGIRHSGVGRSAGLELRVMCSWLAVTRGGCRAKPAVVPYVTDTLDLICPASQQAGDTAWS